VALETLAQIAQILGVLAVVAAIVFGVNQLRQFQQQRHDLAAVELMRMVQDTDFMHAFRIVYGLPDDLGAKQLRALGADTEDAFLVAAKFETMGHLVFRGNVPIGMMEELVGGVAVYFWKKLRPWVEDLRLCKGQPLLLEWYQWISDRLEERGWPDQQPAYFRHRHWKPR
jgi:hypothetical protein